MRIGIGYDVHQLVTGRKLIMGGVTIPYDKGLLGHSDADVLVHALMDAMLGALALGSIGDHFPDTDPTYKGVDSMKLLAHVTKLISDKGYVVSNCDHVIMCQEPKLKPYILTMRANIAAVLGVAADCVGVKATTTEELGYVGRKEGIAAEAVVILARI
jgi:2-C-methyl-D-erythritol 2,4-cyclodiphosphate synthase